jgi:hypothetical protein
VATPSPLAAGEASAVFVTAPDAADASAVVAALPGALVGDVSLPHAVAMRTTKQTSSGTRTRTWRENRSEPNNVNTSHNASNFLAHNRLAAGKSSDRHNDLPPDETSGFRKMRTFVSLLFETPERPHRWVHLQRRELRPHHQWTAIRPAVCEPAPGRRCRPNRVAAGRCHRGQRNSYS